MPKISVLLPTHEHAATLPYALRSVQTQRFDDLEILICGDGATDGVRETVAQLQINDDRIRFFDLPKAPNRGELNRDYVMRQAAGEFIFHHNDDDLWLPGHIETLLEALEHADFVGAMHVNVDTDDKVRAYLFDLERPEFREPWLDWNFNKLGAWANDGFSPIFVAHRRDAFLRLPEGWVTTPPGYPADQAMWHRFLRQPWCRAKFLRWPIALQFPSPPRASWAPEQRAEELRRWTEIIEAPDYAVRLWREIFPELGDRLLKQSLADIELRRAAEAALAHEQGLRATAEASEQTTRSELETELAIERTQRLAAESERNALLSSTSWRATAPLRRLVDWIRPPRH